LILDQSSEPKSINKFLDLVVNLGIGYSSLNNLPLTYGKAFKYSGVEISLSFVLNTLNNFSKYI
jgi:hypothetical protein